MCLCVYTQSGDFTFKRHKTERGNFVFFGSPQNWKWVRNVWWRQGRLRDFILCVAQSPFNLLSYLDNRKLFWTTAYSLYQQIKRHSFFFFKDILTGEAAHQQNGDPLEASHYRNCPSWGEIAHKRGHTLCWLKTQTRESGCLDLSPGSDP